jgi:hypothetical protein
MKFKSKRELENSLFIFVSLQEFISIFESVSANPKMENLYPRKVV